MSIGYVTLGADDLTEALAFYDPVFAAIGWSRGEPDGGWAFYGPRNGTPCVAICKPFDGGKASGGNGTMVAFKAADQVEVAAAHAAALAAGGADEGPPGYRPPDGTSFYGAYFRDPAGAKLCVYVTAG